MNTITTIHQKVLDHFIKRRQADPTFSFVPRKINNKGRLDAGYWFLGNEHYVHISFWNGEDWKEKIHNIGFVIHSDRSCKIELSAQDSTEKAAFLEKVVASLKGFGKDPNKNKWYKWLDGTKYISALITFIKKDKPIIDRLLDTEKPIGISKLNKEFDDKYVSKIIDMRNEQIAYGTVNKIARITWNTKKWHFPSGPEGKSLYAGAHEAFAGFGHEEWLLDKTAIIDGFHYAFLRSLDLKGNQHVGNIYDITLFTTNNLGKTYEVGVIRECECISKEKSAEIYKLYRSTGWLKRMENDLNRVHADVRKFKEIHPEGFFNIRFKFKNFQASDELLEISDFDVNITTTHFTLLPKKTPSLLHNSIETNSTLSDDNDGSGNLKNTNKRKKAFNMECEYDPYHDMMQNSLFELLSSGFEGYQNVKIESGRVDLKAQTPSNHCHYFEIKTDSPKLSIRKALGQVMEYAYFPSNERAEKLIIIAGDQPDEASIEYLLFVRKKFGIPVYYRAFDLECKNLTREY